MDNSEKESMEVPLQRYGRSSGSSGELLFSGDDDPETGDDSPDKRDDSAKKGDKYVEREGNGPRKRDDSIVVRGPSLSTPSPFGSQVNAFATNTHEQVGVDDDLLEHASNCIYDALKYHGPKRKLGARAQFFYLLRTRKKVWFHTYTAVLLVNCLGSYLLEGVVFTTAPQFSAFAYIVNLLCLGVYIADLVFQLLYVTFASFFRRRWNRVQFVVGCVCLFPFHDREK